MQEINGWVANGLPVLLMTNERQHGHDTWAKLTASEIFNTTDLTDDKLKTAEYVKEGIVSIMTDAFRQTIDWEKANLNTFVDHCDKPLMPLPFAADAMMDIQMIRSKEWNDLLKSSDWADAAIEVICSHLATAMNIERLWFADDNPENMSAQTYKLQIQGNQ